MVGGGGKARGGFKIINSFFKNLPGLGGTGGGGGVWQGVILTTGHNHMMGIVGTIIDLSVYGEEWGL